MVQTFQLPFSIHNRDCVSVFGDSLAMVQVQEANSPISVKRFCLDPYATSSLYPLVSWKDDGGDLLLFLADKPKDVETLVSCNCSGLLILEAFDRKPPEKSIVQKVADAYEMLGQVDEKERVLAKYQELFTEKPEKKKGSHFRKRRQADKNHPSASQTTS